MARPDPDELHRAACAIGSFLYDLFAADRSALEDAPDQDMPPPEDTPISQALHHAIHKRLSVLEHARHTAASVACDLVAKTDRLESAISSCDNRLASTAGDTTVLGSRVGTLTKRVHDLETANEPPPEEE